MRRDYYEVLGVPREADAGEIKRAYRELAMRYHPDKNPGAREAEEHFKEVSQAYAVLGDPESRARYDRFGPPGGGFEATLESFTDLFEKLFGDLFGRQKGRRPGRDLRYTLEVDFVEAALGCQKTIRVPSRRVCSDCDGTGARGGERGRVSCGRCAGRGETRLQQGFFTVGKSCPGCGGVGKVVLETCPPCEGEGTVAQEREFTVTIPPATLEGAVRRVQGAGEPGRHGGLPGDLHVVVRVRPHSLLERSGDVVLCEVPISFAEAALGASISVPTLDGLVEMRVPPGTQTGSLFRLRSRGFPCDGGARGDAHIRVVVETPIALTDEQRAIFVQIGNLETPQRAAFIAKLAELSRP